MILKVPSNDWADQFEYTFEEEDTLSDFDDEPDFSEYMWMENESEFDETEMKRLEEEDLMKECFEAMLEDELEAQLVEWQKRRTAELNQALSQLAVSDCNVENSLLNPLAAEFIPQSQVTDSSTS